MLMVLQRPKLNNDEENDVNVSIPFFVCVKNSLNIVVIPFTRCCVVGVADVIRGPAI